MAENKKTAPMKQVHQAEQVTIYIDDVPYQVSPDNNLLAGVLSNKLKLPYFCWHPSMGSVGACRQCAVTQYQDEKDTRGRMVMSCMTPVVDGMRIGLKDHTSTKFREQIIAAMMTNHPHDCPICAEGGECHLQDMTVMTGHTSRGYQGEKRTFTNQYLGELVGHEMNRCITCYRCVRFYKDYAGGKDFDVFGSRNQVYFGRQKDGTLQSPFSGNLVEVCPTGVFTNKLFSAHYTRKWDLQSSPSVCAHCSVGCNTSIGERYGSVRRVMNRYNHDLNGYFLCDRGRFGLGFVNSSKRITSFKGVNTKAGEPLTGMLNEKNLANTLAEHKAEHYIGIGSARASFEANRLLKYLVGRDNFSLGYCNNEMQLALRHKQLLAQYPQQSLAGMENLSRRGHGKTQHDFVLIIGENIEQTAPRLALTIKQVLRNAALDKADEIGVKHWQDAAVRTYAGDISTPLFSLQAQHTNFDEMANGALILTPQRIVSLVERLTKMLKLDFSYKMVVPIQEQATPEGEDHSQDGLSVENSGLSEHEEKYLLLLANALSKASAPLIVSGLSLKSPTLLKAVDELMACLSLKSHGVAPELTMVAPECNSVGNLHFLTEHTLSVEQILTRLAQNKSHTKGKVGKGTTLILLEQDFSQLSQSQLTLLASQCTSMIVLEHTQTDTSQLADVVLPIAAVSESNGHFVNYQGSLQAFYSAHLPVKPVMESWQYLVLLAKYLFSHLEISFSSLKDLHLFFAKHGEPWALQILSSEKEAASLGKVARQTHRSSGRTAMTANQSVHEVKNYLEARASQEELLSYSMEGANASESEEMPYTWAPAWNSNQAIFQHQQEVNGELRHKACHNLLNLTLSSYFDETLHQSLEEQLECLWPTEILEDKNESHSQAQENRLIVIQNLPWFLVEQQSRNIPEFILMFAGNTIELSKQLSEKLSCNNHDIVKLELPQSTVFAKAIITPKLPAELLLVSIFELSMKKNNLSILSSQLTKADDDEITTFEKLEAIRREGASKEKAAILARLKKQDQNVPISFIDKEAGQR